MVNLIKSYITNGEADTSRRKGKSAYDSIQTEQLKKELDRFITILEEEPLRPNTIYTYKRIVAYLLIYCENSKYLFVRELAPFTRLNGEGSSIRVVLQCGQFTVNLRKIVRFYPNYILWFTAKIQD